MCQESAKSSEEDDEMELRQLISFLQLCFGDQDDEEGLADLRGSAGFMRS